MKQFYPLSTFLTEYSEKNGGNTYRPVAIGRYGIRTRESIYSKELAKDYSKNKLIHKNTLTVGMGSVQIDIGVLTDDITYSVSPAYHTYKIAGVNAEYLRYCLECRNQDMFSRFVKRGSRQGKTIDLKRWLTYEIPVYDENRQQEIVDRLNQISELIEKRREQLVQLSELVKSRFIELFGDMFLNSKAWKKQALDSLADVVSGITKGRKTKEPQLIEVPYMAVSNVKDGYIDWTTVKTIQATQQEIEQYRLLPDDVLMTEGGDPDKLGRGAILKEPLQNCIHQNHIFRVRLNESLILPAFFEEYLKHQKAKRYFLGCAKQTTGIASINMQQLKALPVLLPPLELQEQFAAFVEQTDKSNYYSAIIYRKSGEPYCRSEKRSICIYKIFSRCSIWFPITYRIA